MAEPIYRVGEELTPETLLLSMAEMHGIRQGVQGLLESSVPDKIMPPINGLGDLLSESRKASGMSMEEVHSRSRISRSQLSFYERGCQKNPGLRTIQALSYGYRIPFPKLLMAVLWDIRPRANIKKRNRRNDQETSQG